MRLYLDTSVLGALADSGEPQRVEITRRFLGSLAEGTNVGVISNAVQEELALAPGNVREIIASILSGVELEIAVDDSASRELFDAYSRAAILVPRYRVDLRHVAIAVAARVDAIVSWNFRHLVNIRTRRAVNSVNLRLGYAMVEIISPMEV